MEMKGLMGGFYKASEWIMRFSVTNLLWLLTSIPFFIMFMSVFFAESVDQIYFSLFVLAVLAPFFLFPSTSAMFSLVRKWVMGEKDVPLLKTFFVNYKQSYVQSMLGGLLYIAIGVIFYISYKYYSSLEGLFSLLSFFFIMLAVILVISLFFFFCIITHLNMKTLEIIKNSIIITIGRPFHSIAIVGSNAFIIYISFFHFKLFLVFFFMGSMMAFVTFTMFYSMFLKMQEKSKQGDASDNEDDISTKVTR